MYRETVTGDKLRIWLAAALCPVAVQLAAQTDWRRGGLAAVLSLMVTWIVWRKGKFPSWVGLGATMVALAYVTKLLPKAAQVWRGASDPAVPLFLLALALWSSWKGAKTAASVGCVLYWVVLIIYPLVFGAAIGDVRWSWTRLGGNVSWELWLLLLLPTVGKMLTKGERLEPLPVITVILTALSGLLTEGVLGVACDLGFYEMVRAIDLLGLVKHFEAMISAAATLGWFALLNYTLTICGAAGETLGVNGRMFALGGAIVAAAAMLCEIHIPEDILMLGATVFWVLLPILAQGIDVFKKCKKSENTT